MPEHAIVPYRQYSYVPGSAPVHAAFEPIDRWFEEDETPVGREYVVIRLDMSPLRNRQLFLRPWVPKQTMRLSDGPDAPRYRYRIGSLAGQISVPDDFDTMFQAEIEDMFGL